MLLVVVTEDESRPMVRDTYIGPFHGSGGGRGLKISYGSNMMAVSSTSIASYIPPSLGLDWMGFVGGGVE